MAVRGCAVCFAGAGGHNRASAAGEQSSGLNSDEALVRCVYTEGAIAAADGQGVSLRASALHVTGCMIANKLHLSLWLHALARTCLSIAESAMVCGVVKRGRNALGCVDRADCCYQRG